MMWFYKPINAYWTRAAGYVNQIRPDQKRPDQSRLKSLTVSELITFFKCLRFNCISHSRDGEFWLVYVRTIIFRALYFASQESRWRGKASCLDTDYCGVFHIDCENCEWYYFIKTQFTQQILTSPSFYCRLC